MPKSIKQIDLSKHSLDINFRRNSYKKFDFSLLQEYVEALSNNRDYQFQSIKLVMSYLWGGAYNSVSDLALENWETKIEIRQRFQSKENYLRHLPLSDKISGVVHLATGTGKSYVIFAIAYLSIILGKVKRVLVLGPPSTVIEKGLTAKFKEYLYGETGVKLKKLLPVKFRNININLLNENDPIEGPLNPFLFVPNLLIC